MANNLLIPSLTIWALCCSCAPDLPEGVGQAVEQLPATIDYNLHVKPILSDNCFTCHGPDLAKQKAGLRLDIAENAYSDLPENPGKRAIRPGKPGQSELFHRILSSDPDLVMPTPESHLSLSDYEKAVLIKWIQDGAVYKPHWAFIKPEKNKAPDVLANDWVHNTIDTFILARLEKEQLAPAAPAEKALLLRRLSLDLTGLPPAPEEIDQFLADTAPDAYEKQVDRLLQSPHFGEKMATDWLDLARFSDSHGYTVDRLRDMSPYRDWVIQAFNANMPYDRFLHEQLAGDLMPAPTRSMLIATAFNRNHQQNAEGGIIEEEFQTEYVLDRTNTFGDAMLGISLSCARCHDHKYDPVSQKNYFELFSFFNNVQEAGQISWDDAMPAPTLLLPAPEQEVHLRQLHRQIRNYENRVQAALERPSAGFETWLAGGAYQQLTRDTVPTRSLQGFYPFDGSSLRNRARARSAGTMKRDAGKPGDLPVYSIRENGQALQLDGDAYLDLNETGVFRKSEAFTIGIRVYLPQSLNEGVIFHKSIAERLYNYRGYHLYLKGDKLEANLAYAAPANAITVTTRQTIPKDKWIHLTLTYDGSSRAGGLHIFLDGQEMATDIQANKLTKDILFKGTHQVGLQIGSWWRGLGLKGAQVDDIAVYSRVLTPFEIQVLTGTASWQKLTTKPFPALTDMDKTILRNYYLAVVDPEIQTLRDSLTYWRTSLSDASQEIRELMVMQEMPSPKQAHILIRGEYDNKGDAVVPGTPEAILAYPDTLPRNRLGLAQWLTLPDHPLTARVAVNRYWQNLFGAGLVKTSEDFGNQGELPSHPELLDWLAVTFQESGWDVKKLHKLLVMSATYQQDSRATPELREADPGNRLLARGPSKRLTAEMIRDNALAASGLLQRTIGGESVKPYQPEGLWEINSARYIPDTGAAVYRRSLYVVTKRSVPNPTLATFDATSRSYCVVRRQQTNTPLQALVTLNDPTFTESAKVLGEQMSGFKELQQAIRHTYRKLTGRKVPDRELVVLEQLYHHQHAIFAEQPDKARGWLEEGQYVIDPSSDPAVVAAHTVVASTILNSDATLTQR